ncbi:c-type cytochrome [Paraburkholderia flava]|uniref:c-type cytochrome n=1 Tax=Paraburkholderia flava TaxID=2547393 RepID=UPI00105B358B|nr:cytochrome c [Paraburkholderia flava]
MRVARESGRALLALVIAIAIPVAAVVGVALSSAQSRSSPAPAVAPQATSSSTGADANTRARIADPADAATAADASTNLIARGAYLAKAADCAGCHTAAPRAVPGHTPIPASPFAGGLGMGSPFGTIYSTNITPDPNAGIGRYTYDDFARTLRHGVTPDGKRLYPAMPFPSFAKIDDADMHALYAYFMHGVQPVATPAPSTRLPFPFNQRWALMFWSWAFAPGDRFKPRADRDAQWNRGAYLVQSLGHCGACHTPRGPAYEELGYAEGSRFYLTGGNNDHWFAPNLTGDAGAGLGRYSAQDIAAFLKTGHGGGLVTFGSMVQVVEDSTQYMSDDDLAAIAGYLKSLPVRAPYAHYDAGSHAAQQTSLALKTGDVQRPGAGIFQSDCARCHRADGMGVAQKYPRLAGNPAVLAPDTTSLVRLLVEGGGSPHTETGPASHDMPSFAGKLTDTEMARVLTFVRTTWGNDADPVTTRDVTRTRSALHK